MQRQAENAGYFTCYLCTEFRLVGLLRQSEWDVSDFFEECYFLIFVVLSVSGVWRKKGRKDSSKGWNSLIRHENGRGHSPPSGHLTVKLNRVEGQWLDRNQDWPDEDTLLQETLCECCKSSQELRAHSYNVCGQGPLDPASWVSKHTL